MRGIMTGENNDVIIQNLRVFQPDPCPTSATKGTREPAGFGTFTVVKMGQKWGRTGAEEGGAGHADEAKSTLQASWLCRTGSAGTEVL